jgi:putative ABC transport system ATP-binding protein
MENAHESAAARGPATAESLIVLKDVSKDYESGAGVVRALRDVALDIAKGELIAVVGTSGSGKSTLMNILGCLDRPTRGTYLLSGLDIGERSGDGRAIVRNRLIGFVFQGFNLLPRTTALENVELPLVYRGVGTRERRKQALAALDAVGLADRVHHTPNQLSGGQQQRVAIARALVTDPPLLLADEPTGNLDTRTSLEVLALLQRLNRDRGITVLLVTHEHDIAACASRVITFRDGRIVSDERVAEPVDAAAELERLPPPEQADARALERELDPAERRRRELGGPVPGSVYVAMAVAGIVGVLLGVGYNKFVIEHATPWIPLAFGLALESWVAASIAKRRLGRPMTSDQRVRVSLFYTLGVACALAPLVALGVTERARALVDRLGALGPLGVAGAVGVTLLVIAAVSLARYLLLSLVAPLVPGKRA